MHTMSEFQRLFEEDRSSRRTIADAIEVLRQACDFNSNDRAEVRIGPLRLSPRDVVGLVDAAWSATHDCSRGMSYKLTTNLGDPEE
jgi:hypothetical protein